MIYMLAVRPVLSFNRFSFAWLAPLAIEAVGKALVQLRKQGRSLLLVEQRVDLALEVCDRLYVLSEGVIARHSRCDEVDPASRALIDAYLG